MGQYRHVGTKTVIYDTPFDLTKFGQLVEVPDELASNVKSLMPVAEFNKLNFNPDHLKKYGDVVMTHHMAPPDFIEKRDLAWAWMSNHPMNTGVAPVETPTTKEEEDDSVDHA